jgi:hypothetical protein
MLKTVLVIFLSILKPGSHNCNNMYMGSWIINYFEN